MHLGIPLTQLKNFGEHALKRYKLLDKSEAEFRQYLETSTKDERGVLQFIHTLRTEDMLAKSTEEHVENWTPSTKLAKNIRKFIYALLLLPNIQYYSGTVESTVINAMWSSSVKDLPTSNSFNCDQLTSFVAREFSLARHAIKKTIQTSIDKHKGTDIRPVAALATELLKHAPNVNVTLGLYFRLVLICSHVVQNHPISEFWNKVDEQLDELHREGPENFVIALETLYEDDLELYDDPTQPKNSRLATMLGTPAQSGSRISALAPKIQHVAKKQGTKRKCRTHEPEDDKPEPEQGPEPSGDHPLDEEDAQAGGNNGN
ncbi:hypothetical protein B0H14DRAFT_3487676 [Mycena olivaceomarginata]|nr:hypothetical protein B0H14DRAFT_3487676 [Mycena olivaceomarginata]